MKKKAIGLQKKNSNMSFFSNTLSKNSLPGTRKRGFAEFSKLCPISLRQEHITNVDHTTKRWRNNDFKWTV
jgi:hypothetical protein